jgi:hypothetical protein
MPVKKRVTPQDKKKLAYEKDHYVSASESRHAFRKNWPKKKAMLNQKHRHRATQALHKLEKMGDMESIEGSSIEVTAEQLRKVDPREKLNKFGVRTLREYVERNSEKRESRAFRRRQERELITERCLARIAAMERDVESKEALALLREIAMSGSWGWDLSRFLRWYPDWKPRLVKKLQEAERAVGKARMKQKKKETEKQRAKTLRNSIQKQMKIRRS